MRLLSLVALVLLGVLTTSTVAAQTPTQSASDPQAVAVLQTAINAIGGLKAIGALQSWTIQGEGRGSIANGLTSEILAITPSQSSSTGSTTAKPSPPWAQPRSIYVPALVSTILNSISQNATFFVSRPQVSSGIAPVVFSFQTKTGKSVIAQRWYLDPQSSLPTRIDFFLPPRIGPVEGFAGVVYLSDYRSVGGVQYPFQIEFTANNGLDYETVTLQSITPSTSAPSIATTPVGGAQ